MAEARSLQNVLLVDDDERILGSWKRAARDRNIMTANDAASARQIAATERPDLAIVDLRLGTTSGIDLIRELKRDLPDLMVVLCSGINVERYHNRSVFAWLREEYNRGVAIGGLCTGAHVLAAAGLLSNKRCAIHWENLPGFAFGFSASWEIDIWSKLRNATKAATLRYLASQEGRNFAITNLVGELATRRDPALVEHADKGGEAHERCRGAPDLTHRAPQAVLVMGHQDQRRVDRCQRDAGVLAEILERRRGVQEVGQRRGRVRADGDGADRDPGGREPVLEGGASSRRMSRQLAADLIDDRERNHPRRRREHLPALGLQEVRDDVGVEQVRRTQSATSSQGSRSRRSSPRSSLASPSVTRPSSCARWT